MNQLYHHLSPEELERHFEVSVSEGLSNHKIVSNQAKYGPNSFQELKAVTSWQILWRQCANFFIVLLLAAAVISYFVDGLGQAIILFLIVIINVALGFFQERKAERALLELKRSFQAQTKVVRNGQVRVIPNEELTLGDIVIIDTGDKVPADIRLIEAESMRVDESALTGESVPVSKRIAKLPEDTPLADRHNMLYGSTLVVAGRGKGIVAAIGQNTEFGKIAGLVTAAESKTPLENQITYLGKRITLLSAFVAILVFVAGYSRGLELWPLLTFTIALLVAAVPESLPTAITLALAIGVARAAKHKAVVRRMAAVETLGTVNIIATDKTGTLTNNHLVVDTVSLPSENGWRRHIFNGQAEEKEVGDLLTRGIVCSNINIKEDGSFIGDPVEVAIAEGAKRVTKSVLEEALSYKRLFEVPFDSDKKYMAVLCERDGRGEIVAKGSVERIVSFCDLSKEKRETAAREARYLSSKGYKVIAVAYRHGEMSSRALEKMKLAGFLAMADEPAEGVAEAIKKVMRAGIRPIMITGDHPDTARFVAEKLGVKVHDYEIIGEKALEKMSPEEMRSALQTVKIFARTTPADKIAIVKTLQEMGYTVAMTGDGVNDAPALKEAHVGIAMGVKGTEVAKSASDVILLDDQYRTILSAVEYGRTIYDNIKNVIVHLLSGNLNEILLVGLAFLFGLPSPITTIQILWVNMVTDSLPALALSFEKPGQQTLREKPRSASTKSLNETLWYAGYLSIASFFFCIAIYFWGLRISDIKAQTLTFTFFVLIELAYCFSLRSKKRIWQSPASFFENKYLIGAVAFSLFLQGIIFVGPLREIFGLASLASFEVFALIAMTTAAFLAAEVIRFLRDSKIAREVKRNAMPEIMARYLNV